jgi:CheY-like chemotaxis protein
MALKILIADDLRDSADTLAAVLSSHGYHVHVVYDGASALHAASQLVPDVLLLDLGMPGIDGWSVCKLLRSEPWGRDLFIIAQTGWGRDADVKLSREVGFDLHLLKPLDIDYLLELLGRIHRRGFHGPRD